MKTPGENELYKIEYLSEVVEDDITALPKKIRIIIKNAIEKRLMLNPIEFGKPLRFSLNGHRRLRVSNYRVVYRIEIQRRVVIIIAIKHRKCVYDKF